MVRERRRDYDVAIVGASIAGSAAAILFGRAGLKVALIDRIQDAAAHKRVCTHYIQASAVPTLERMGVMPALAEAGAVRAGMVFWSRAGWVRPPEDPNQLSGVNVRREKLDPLLRSIACNTPGVELLLGRTARDLSRNGSEFEGVIVASRDGSQTEISARLIVGADGRDSLVARLAGSSERIRPHRRFMYYAYFQGGILTGSTAKTWILEPDIAYALPTDDGLVLLACALTQEKLPAFRQDLATNFQRLFQHLPDGPHFDDSQRVSDFVGMLQYANVSRRPIVSNVALIGDAALVADYIWGLGCGWALQSAEWLVDATKHSLQLGAPLNDALKSYAKKHRSALGGHFLMTSDYASGRPLNPVERLLLSAAAKDSQTARHFARYTSRQIGVLQLLSPLALGRALIVNATRTQ